MSSPTLIVSFAVLAGPIVAEIDTTSREAVVAFVLGFFGAGLVWSCALAATSSGTGKLLGVKFVRGISLLSAALFLYFAVKVFLNGFELLGG